MPKNLNLSQPCSDSKLPRIGGGALIGNVLEWPVAPDGRALTLIMSIPTNFLIQNTKLILPKDKYISVFSYYAADDYFLDSITYHGTDEELEWIKKGFTRVFMHEPQEEIIKSTVIPSMEIIPINEIGDENNFGGSKVGGKPYLLQAEPLSLDNQVFAMQLYGNDFPKPYQGIFGLSGAIGYLFVESGEKAYTNELDIGTFFVQVT